MSLTSPAPAPASSRWIVALPARDEAERLPDALLALNAAARRAALPVGVLVLANSCSDETAAIARALGRSLTHAALEVREDDLPPALAHAGGARAAAVLAARDAFGGEGLILTTDADARLAEDGFARAEAAFAAGADLALAKISCVPDPLCPVSRAALDWGTPPVLWRHAVRQLVETLRTGVVPDPPLHDDYGGAGIALTSAAYDRLGGFLPVPSEEDLRLIRAADAMGLRVDRSCGLAVTVLARREGRAAGGMAAALRRNEAAARRGEVAMVEHHEATLARLLADPGHANAFARVVTRREPAGVATAAIERAIALHGAAASRAMPSAGRLAS